MPYLEKRAGFGGVVTSKDIAEGVRSTERHASAIAPPIKPIPKWRDRNGRWTHGTSHL